MGGGSLENRATLPQRGHCRIVCTPILCESPRPLRPGGHQNKERPPLMGRPLLCGRLRSERPGAIKEVGVELNDELATSVTAFRYYTDDILLLQ